MRAILTPLFFVAATTLWGQAELPFTQTPPHIIKSAVAAWEANVADAVVLEDEASGTNDFVGFAKRGNRNTIESVQRGIWSESSTWDCDCVPGGDDNVVVHHEVSFVTDAVASSVLVSTTGTLVDLVGMTLTFDGNFVSSSALPHMTTAHFVANGIGGTQSLDANMTLSSLTAMHRTALSIAGEVEVTGNVMVDDATVTVTEAGQLILSENHFGRATVMRPNDGELLGLVTRQITLPATPNRNMSFVEQRIAIGLEGVKVSELVGDIPTWGFNGADDPAGFANIGYWSANADFNYAIIESAEDVLPVWEGVYLALAPAESYTLQFTGTMPSSDLIMDIPGDAFTALFGNATHANVDLSVISEQLGANKVGLDCWNINTLQYDHYVDGINTNGLNGTLQPNTTCQYLPSGANTLTLAVTGHMPNGTEANPTTDLDGKIVFSAENASGYRDETVIAIREGASVDFLGSEDAINTSSLYSACDMYLLDEEGNRSGIAQLGFDREPIVQFNLMLGANRPLDGEYLVTVEALDWADGCAFIVMGEDATPQPLEAGELGTISLSTGVNNNHTVATVYLVPPVRAEISSPGCEGEGETAIDVLATGDGPWTVALNDNNGQTLTGEVSADGVATHFGDLASGTYTYVVLNDGDMGCGAETGAHTVIRPTSLAIATNVTHDCGEGGAVVANVASEEVSYDWSHGATGAVISGLDGGTYTVVATNDFGCKDTLDVTVLSAPDVLVTSTDGTCDGSVDADIEVDAMHDSARYNVVLRNAQGEQVDAKMDEGTPLFFENVSSGTYTVELQLLGDYGCAPEMEEVSLVQPVPMTLTSTSQAQCDDDQLGSASTVLVGGTGEVTYFWSNGMQSESLTDVEAGNYALTVTDEAGCQKTTNVTVAQSPQLEVTAMSPGCDGNGVAGFDMVSASDATWTVDVYSMEGTLVQSTTSSVAFEVADLPTGTYTVTYGHDVNDGCPAKSMEATLTEASNLEVAVTTTPMACGEHDAGAIDLEVTGGLGDITVAWDHGAEGASLSGLAGGQYYAVVTDDNGCTKDVRVMVEDSPTVEANFTVPNAGLTDGVNGMTMSFTNTSEGNITGQTWYFGDTETPSYDFHATHTFEAAGAYDVFLNVWNDKCSHTIRKTVVASQGESNADDLGALVTNVAEGNLTEIHPPVTTESGWMMDLGPAGEGMTVHVFDLTGRQLCSPVGADGNGQIWIEGDQWPSLVLLRLVHEPTNSIRTWKMVR